jgi:hypothetical protein
LGGFTKTVKPPGLTPQNTLLNVFFCLAKSKVFSKLVYEQVNDFPLESLFSSGLDPLLSFLDPEFKTLERIGGTVSHLENELQEKLR